MIGQSLSHYRITAALGAGGMGEVYRATDTNLGRDVAIKVLPAEVVEDAERLGRFKREAHLLASLNHPNIGAIYGFEEADGTPFLALELVEGEELKDRIARGALPVDEALEIAEQIAEALEEAHNKGIVHRDLKPANVKITPDGKVKVLDFGLAKAWAGEAPDGSSSSAALSQSPTMANTGTVAGLILGTAAYMSPEQARGKPVDKRADVWAFGVLLWEMLTGRALFAGDTVTDVIASVVKEEPDLDALPKGTPGAVRHLLARCLRKDPRTRLPDVGAARLDLQDALAGESEEAKAPERDQGNRAVTEIRRVSRQRGAWAAAAIASAGVAAVLAYLHLTEPPEPRATVHFVLDMPDDLMLGEFESPAVSPDGRHVAYSAGSPGERPWLWIHALDSPEARTLSGTEGAARPFWSPDAKALAFAADGQLKKVTLPGGTVQRICTLPRTGLYGGTWNEEGTIVFSAGGASATLFSVAASGGEPQTLSAHDASRQESGHWWPRFLPDGQHFVFLAGGAEGGLDMASLDAPDQRLRLLPEGFRTGVAEGHLLFVRDGILLAQPLDAERGELTGNPAPVAEGVASWTGDVAWGWFSAEEGRVLAYREAGASDVQLAWFDRNGKRLGTVGKAGRYGQIALSPDGRRVAAEIADGTSYDLWVIDATRGVATRVTADPANERDPVWSPAGDELAYATDASGDQNVVRHSLGGGEPASALPGGIGATEGARDFPESWAREGRTLVYLTKGEEHEVWAVPLDGDGEAKLALRSAFILDETHLSPDGRWLAYISDESGGWEVYVEPFLRPGEKVRVSADGGGQPRWRGDSRELFYLTFDGRLQAVDIGEGAAGPEVGLPTSLFRMGPFSPDFDDYGVSADGQRFLVKTPVEESGAERIHVVTNWPSLLE